MGEFVAQRDANLYLTVMQSVSTMLAQTLPQVVQNVQKVNSDVSKLEQEFYGKYADLNKPEYSGGLSQILLAIKRNEPNLTRMQAMEKLGTLGRAYYGLPATQPKPNGGKSKPFVPAAKAAAGGGARAIPNGQQVDPMADLNNMLMSNFDM